MTIRNEKIINKLKKSKTNQQTPSELNDSVVITADEWRDELGVSSSNKEIVQKVLHKSAAFIGCCLIINTFALYFFDLGIDTSDFDFMFFLFSVIAIYTAGDVLLQLQIKKVFESDMDFDNKIEALMTRKIFIGWHLKLIWLGIFIATVGFLFSFISLVFNDFDLDSNYFNSTLLFFVLASSLIGLIKIGETFTFVVFFILSGISYTVTNWLFDEYHVNEYHHSLYSFIAEEVLGFEQEEPEYYEKIEQPNTPTLDEEDVNDSTEPTHLEYLPKMLENPQKN
jgi:hypothetical protein